MTNQLQPLHPGQILAESRSQEIKANLKSLWNMPYPADPVLEPELAGMTYGQVALMRQIIAAANGVGEAVDRVMDRLIGRPAQINTNLNVGASYKDFLDEVARAEGIINVTAVPAGTPDPVAQAIR